MTTSTLSCVFIGPGMEDGATKRLLSQISYVSARSTAQARIAFHESNFRWDNVRLRETDGHNKSVRKRVLQQILSGSSDAGVRFDDLRSLLVFSKDGVAEILNLQPRRSMAKPYQVKQARAIIVRYKLAEGIE